MTGDDEFREQFRHMRKTHSVGVILGLLAEVVKDEADAEFVAGDFRGRGPDADRPGHAVQRQRGRGRGSLPTDQGGVNAMSTKDISDASPNALDQLVGQRAVVAQVRVALDAARHDAATFPSALLTGGPGLGKSQLARCIAAEMGTDFTEVLGQAIREPADLNAVLLAATPRAVVHVDEAHELDKEFQTALYLALDQKKVLLSTRSNRGPQAIPLADFTLLLSTTDEYCLLQPLRDRMRLSLRLQYYADEELVEVARNRADVLGWPVDGSVLPEIARRARGTPRIALRLLQACRRVCRAEGVDRITSGPPAAGV